MRNFRQYDTWHDAISITSKIYKLSSSFPQAEKFGLSNQIQRAAVSIASNIAEGASRTSELDFAHFLEIALGSAFEVETQIIIAKELKYITINEYEKIIFKLACIEKRLNSFIGRLRAKK